MDVATLSPVEQYVLGHVRPELDIDIGPAPEELVSWLKQTAIPLRSARSDAENEDLVPLRTSIGEARVVGMGEATHGTSEFFTLKHRIFKFLVTEMGFNVLGVESGFAESLAIGAYVEGGPRPSFAGQHPELVDLVEWMRSWNSSGRRPTLHFFGFDMQSPTAAVSGALAVARRIDHAIARIAGDLAPLGSSFGASHYRAAPVPARARLQAGLGALLESLDAAAAEDDRDGEIATAALLARSAQWAERYSFFPTQRERDEAMAEMVVNIMESVGPEARIALWAHNAHVQRGDLVELVGGQSVPTMGALLHERLGRDYVAVSFAFGRGAFRAENLLGGGARSFKVSAAPDCSLDGALARTGHPLAAFPLGDAAVDGAAAEWLAARPAARCIGGASTDNLAELSFVRADPRTAADVIVFVAETTAGLPSLAGADSVSAPSKSPSAPVASTPNLTFQDVADDGCPQGWELRDAAGEGLARVENDCLVLSRRGSDDGAVSLVHRLAVEGDQDRIVDVRATLATEAGPWPGGAHLTLHYESHAAIDEQLVRPPFALAPTFPIGDHHWHQVHLALEVPASVEAVELGLAVVGNGTARLRSLSLSLSEVAG